MRVFLVAACTLLMAGGCAAAQGCGPTRLKVSEAVILDVAPAEAWRIVGNFQDTSWAGNTRAVSGSGGNVPDRAVRKVVLDDGSSLEESLYKYDAAGMSYAYHIDKTDPMKLPVQNTSVTLEVVPLDRGAKSEVHWRAAFYRFLLPNEPAPDIADANAAKAIKTLGEALLGRLKTRSEAKT